MSEKDNRTKEQKTLEKIFGFYIFLITFFIGKVVELSLEKILGNITSDIISLFFAIVVPSVAIFKISSKIKYSEFLFKISENNLIYTAILIFTFNFLFPILIFAYGYICILKQENLKQVLEAIRWRTYFSVLVITNLLQCLYFWQFLINEKIKKSMTMKPIEIRIGEMEIEIDTLLSISISLIVIQYILLWYSILNNNLYVEKIVYIYLVLFFSFYCYFKFKMVKFLRRDVVCIKL